MMKLFQLTVAAGGVLLRDLVGLGGAASVAYGAWLAWPPAGFMVGGLFALGGAWLAARTAAMRDAA